MTATSLRLRLTLIILGPLLAIAAAVGVWQQVDARAKAADLFDRSLLSTALAIAADVGRSGGDAISFRTRDLLADTSGGPAYYHAYAPDGVFVTGYATPPVPVGARPDPEAELAFFDARYHRRDVRVVKLRDVTTIDGLSGVFTFTVWQDVAVRDTFVRDLAARSFVVMAALIGTVALVVWFGVNRGLRPLLDLEDAISSRNPDDLRPILRPVPVEARGLVERLNALFGKVQRTIEAQNEFVSNAAHQLRNPIAGVLALAEAIVSAPTPAAARRRAGELLTSARRASDLANRLLTLERLRTDGSAPAREPVDLNRLAREVVQAHGHEAEAGGVRLAARTSDGPAVIAADATMVREAIANLADNALRHGGADLSQVEISVARRDAALLVEVADDGHGISPGDVPKVLARFGQASPASGSGLGLSIAEAVAERHGGRLDLDPSGPGLTVTLRFPDGPGPPAA